MKRKPIILKDRDNKKKTLEFGEPFLSDGTFWLTVRYEDEILSTIKLNDKEINRMYQELCEYGHFRETEK